MERSSTIGYVLIFVLFAGFWYFSNQNAEDLEAQQEKAKQEQVTEAEEVADTPQVDSPSTIENIVTPSDSSPESITVLANDLLTIELSSRGGVPKKVSLNEYQRYDSSALVLFEENQMSLGYTIPLVNGTLINTLAQNFTVQQSDDNEVVMTANLDGGAKITQTYTVVPGSYKVGYKVAFDGFDNVISPNNRYAELNWSAKIQLQEKSIKDERNVSTVYYKYAFEDDVDYLSETSDEDDDKLQGNIKWISFKQKFFNQTLINENQFTEDGIEISTTTPSTEEYIKDFKAKLFIPIEDNSEVGDMALYYGPNHYQTLQKEEIELQKMIPLGWGIFGWVNKGIVIPIFNWLDNYFASYGLIILLLTLIIKMALFFPMFKVYKSTAKMKLLKPELDEIKERTGSDTQKAQQEQMKLYKQAGVSPLGGCLPQLVQMPILFAMFRFFPSSIELRQERLWWAEDLSTYDSIWTFPNGFEIPFYGDHVSLFTLMMTAVTLVYTYMNSQNSGQMVGPMKTVMYLMPLMFLGFFNNYAAALSFYYFLSTCITIIQNFVIRKFVIDEDKLHKQIQESKKKKVKNKKSGLQKRLEDMAKKRGIDPKTGKSSNSSKKKPGK